MQAAQQHLAQAHELKIAQSRAHPVTTHDVVTTMGMGGSPPYSPPGWSQFWGNPYQYHIPTQSVFPRLPSPTRITSPSRPRTVHLSPPMMEGMQAARAHADMERFRQAQSQADMDNIGRFDAVSSEAQSRLSAKLHRVNDSFLRMGSPSSRTRSLPEYADSRQSKQPKDASLPAPADEHERRHKMIEPPPRRARSARLA